jgi:putative drug exporter of the RND superfamily
VAARDAGSATDSAPSTAPSLARRITALPYGRRTKYLVLGFWILVIAVTAPLSSKLMSAGKNDASAHLPASAESAQELNLQGKSGFKNLNPAVVAYVRPSGITPADLRKAAARGDPGLSAHVAGPAAGVAGQVKIFKGIDSTLLYATLAVVIILLLLTYRSPVLWILPIVSAGVALTAAEAVIYLLTQHGLTVNGQSAGMLIVLVLGASTGYALLLVARYREELRRHADRHNAMAVALRRAGPAIIASAATVIAGMLCLLVAESADISRLGPVAAIGIGVGLLAMVTLLPALLVIAGRWIFWPARPRYGSGEPTTRGFWARVQRLISHRPRAVWSVPASPVTGAPSTPVAAARR